MSDHRKELNDLARVIETLQAYIKHNSVTIGSNETRTRNALIDPLLRALGWADPAVITSECLMRYGNGANEYVVADYALHTPSRRCQPFMYIEAKRMREDLIGSHRRQALQYFHRRSVDYVGLTNGDLWVVYERNDDQVHPVVEISIRKDSASYCAEQLLPFKRSGMGIRGWPSQGSRRMRDTRAVSESIVTYYDVLGIKSTASPDEINRAYRHRISQVHPDVSTVYDAQDKAKRLNEAYSVLRDPAKRAEYDRSQVTTQAYFKPTEKHARSAPQARNINIGDVLRRSVVFCGKVILWAFILAMHGVVIGYFVGFWVAQRLLNSDVGVVAGIVAAVFLVVTLLMSLWLIPSRRISIYWLFDVKGQFIQGIIGLTFLGFIVLMVYGGFIGYAIGFATTRMVYDAIATIGAVCYIVAFSGLSIGFVVTMFRASYRPQFLRLSP